MKQRRRKLIIVAAVFIALVAVVAVVIHLPGVQRSAWNRLAESIEEGSGWQIATDDIGQVWESWREASYDLSVGVGFGVRWSTPIGPLWADVAWPVANIGISSRTPKFYLGIGRPF